MTTLGCHCLKVTSGILCSFSYNLFKENHMQFIFSEKRSQKEKKKNEYYIYWTGVVRGGGSRGDGCVKLHIVDL